MKYVLGILPGNCPNAAVKAVVTELRAALWSEQSVMDTSIPPPKGPGATVSCPLEHASSCDLRQTVSEKTSDLIVSRELDTSLVPHVARTTTTFTVPLVMAKRRSRSFCSISPKTAVEGSRIEAVRPSSTMAIPGANNVVSPLTASERSSPGGTSTNAVPSERSRRQSHDSSSLPSSLRMRRLYKVHGFCNGWFSGLNSRPPRRFCRMDKTQKQRHCGI